MVANGGIEGPFKWLKSKYPSAASAVGLIGDNTTGRSSMSRTPTAAHAEPGLQVLYSRDATYTETSFLPDIIKMKNAGVKLVFEPTVTGNLVNTIALEMKQESLNALLVSGTNAYEKDFSPGSAGNGTLVTGVYALYRGEDAKAVPAVATFDKWVKKIDPTSQLDIYTVDAWINAELFVQALKAAGPNPTRAGLDAQLDKITSFNAGGLTRHRTRRRRSRDNAGWSRATERNVAADRARPQVGVRLQSQGLLSGQLQRNLSLSNCGAGLPNLNSLVRSPSPASD